MNKIFNSKSNVIVQNNLVYGILFFVIILIYIFLKYDGNSSQVYINLWSHLLNKYRFTDPYLNEIDIPGIILLGKIFNILNINPNNDAEYFPFILIIQLTLIPFFYKILSENLDHSYEKNLVLLISLIGINIISPGIPIFPVGWPGTVTFYSLIFFPIFLYGLLKKKIIILIISSSLMFYLHPKIGFLPILIGITYSFFFWKENLKKIWILFPFFIFLWFVLEYSANLSKIEKISLIKEYYFYRDREEASFIFHPLKNTIIQIITLIIYPFLIKKIYSSNFRTLSTIVYILCLTIFFFDWVYSLFFVEIIPIPQVYTIGPPRLFFVFEFFFFILLFNFILKLSIEDFLKAIIFGFIFFSKTFSQNSLLYAITLSILFIGIFFFLKKKINLTKNIFLVFSLFILPGTIFLLIQKVFFFDFYALSKVGIWTTNHDDHRNKYKNFSKEENKDLFLFFKNLRNCKDFPLFDPLRGEVANKIAFKSKFNSEVQLTLHAKKFSLEKSKNFYDRDVLRNKISNEFKKKQIIEFSIDDLKKLEKYNIAMIIPENFIASVPKKLKKKKIDSFNYIVFFNENIDIKDFCKS